MLSFSIITFSDVKDLLTVYDTQRKSTLWWQNLFKKNQLIQYLRDKVKLRDKAQLTLAELNEIAELLVAANNSQQSDEVVKRLMDALCRNIFIAVAYIFRKVGIPFVQEHYDWVQRHADLSSLSAVISRLLQVPLTLSVERLKYLFLYSSQPKIVDILLSPNWIDDWGECSEDIYRIIFSSSNPERFFETFRNLYMGSIPLTEGVVTLLVCAEDLEQMSGLIRGWYRKEGEVEKIAKIVLDSEIKSKYSFLKALVLYPYGINIIDSFKRLFLSYEDPHELITAMNICEEVKIDLQEFIKGLLKGGQLQTVILNLIMEKRQLQISGDIQDAAQEFFHCTNKKELLDVLQQLDKEKIPLTYIVHFMLSVYERKEIAHLLLEIKKKNAKQPVKIDFSQLSKVIMTSVVANKKEFLEAVLIFPASAVVARYRESLAKTDTPISLAQSMVLCSKAGFLDDRCLEILEESCYPKEAAVCFILMKQWNMPNTEIFAFEHPLVMLGSKLEVELSLKEVTELLKFFEKILEKHNLEVVAKVFKYLIPFQAVANLQDYLELDCFFKRFKDSTNQLFLLKKCIVLAKLNIFTHGLLSKLQTGELDDFVSMLLEAPQPWPNFKAPIIESMIDRSKTKANAILALLILQKHGLLNTENVGIISKLNHDHASRAVLLVLCPKTKKGISSKNRKRIESWPDPQTIAISAVERYQSKVNKLQSTHLQGVRFFKFGEGHANDPHPSLGQLGMPTGRRF